MNFEQLLDADEDVILSNVKNYIYVSQLLKFRQFSEEFLIKTLDYYDSWECLKTQKNLSPNFCFKYLYDKSTDTKDNWTDYNDIVRYLNKQQIKYPSNYINSIFNEIIRDKIFL